jgi:hypothetical protein
MNELYRKNYITLITRVKGIDIFYRKKNNYIIALNSGLYQGIHWIPMRISFFLFNNQNHDKKLHC